MHLDHGRPGTRPLLSLAPCALPFVLAAILQKMSLVALSHHTFIERAQLTIIYYPRICYVQSVQYPDL